MKIKDLNVSIRSSNKIKDYSAVDIRIRFDGIERELHELLPDNDFVSKFDQILELLKKEIVDTIREYEE